MTDRLPVPEALCPEDPSEAVRLVQTYFGMTRPPVPYTGAFFERLGGGGDRPEIANEITTEDITAVTLLSVRIPQDGRAPDPGSDARRGQ